MDPGPPGSYYKLSAVDVNGNVSVYVLLTPAGTLEVDEGVRLPFSLDGVGPNPSDGEVLLVSFSLPRTCPATLELYDVSGRRVLTREVGSLGPGRHQLELRAGTTLRAGLYLLRLEQGQQERSIKALVVR